MTFVKATGFCFCAMGLSPYLAQRACASSGEQKFCLTSGCVVFFLAYYYILYGVDLDGSCITVHLGSTIINHAKDKWNAYVLMWVRGHVFLKLWPIWKEKWPAGAVAVPALQVCVHKAFFINPPYDCQLPFIMYLVSKFRIYVYCTYMSVVLGEGWSPYSQSPWALRQVFHW
jgi:hypothetical protein